MVEKEPPGCEKGHFSSGNVNQKKVNGNDSPGKEKAVNNASYSSNSKEILASSMEGGSTGPYVPAMHRVSDKGLGTMGALFHMIKGSLGAGILSMPVAFKNGGLWVSLVGTIFVGVVATHCVHILVFCSQALCRRLKQPCLGYAATAEAAFATGPHRLRKYTVLVREFADNVLMITYFLGCGVYIVFIASSVKQVVENHTEIELSARYYSLMLVVVILPFGSIRHLRYLAPFSFFAILCLLFGCGFVVYEVFADLPPLNSRPAFTSFKKLPMFYATVLFALDGIGTVFPIENSMKNPHSLLGIVGVLNAAMGLLIFLYGAIGFLGYLRYGDATQGIVTLNLGSFTIGEIVKLMVAFNVVFSYALCFCVPCEILWRKLEPKIGKTNPTRAYYTMRTLMILGSLIIAAALPDLESFVGLAGAICNSTLGLLFPSIIELVTFWEDKDYMGRFHWRLYKNLFLIIMWFIALIAGTQASVNNILKTFETND